MQVLSMSLFVASYSFGGWNPAGTIYFQTVTAPQVQVCREDTSDVPAGWPEGTTIGPGVACTDVPAAADAKKLVKGAAFSKKSLFGLEVKVETKEKKNDVVVLNGDKRQVIATFEGDAPLKIAEQFWRNDGRVVALSLTGEKQAHANVAALLVGGPAGRKLAEKLHDDGMKLYKKRDWSGAGKLFEDAIAADGEWAPARYARAAAEAQGGVGRTAMIDNLQWLKEHADKDATAKKLLGQAKGDTAFDAWVGEPEVRELTGLPKVSAMDVPTRLLERAGTWTQQGATCKSAWLTLAFKKGGAVTLTVQDSCKGKKTSKSATGTYKTATPPGPFVVELKKALEGVTFPLKSTIVLDASYQQLKLTPDGGGEPLGPFEPGAARVDDSTL